MMTVMLYTISDLGKNVKGVTIRVRVTSKSQTRLVKTQDGKEHRVVDVGVGDRTGRISLSLWDEMVDTVDTGDLIDIDNAYITSFKGKLFLNVGKFGNLEKVEDDEFPEVEELIMKPWKRSLKRRPFKP